MVMSSIILIAVVLTILLRPWKINESIPAIVGALLVLALGIVNLSDLKVVSNAVSGAAITIISTIIMSSVLDKAGFFRWAAIQVARKAGGNGRKLFILTLLLSFLMTMFFNNDGSILITTPIILQIMSRLQFNKKEAFPYLIGGALIASASSAPIGVSNLANLIALRIVGLNLNTYAALMFVPSIIGIIVCGDLLFLLFRKVIPEHYDIKLLNQTSSEKFYIEGSLRGPFEVPRPEPLGKPKLVPHEGPKHVLHEGPKPGPPRGLKPGPLGGPKPVPHEALKPCPPPPLPKKTLDKEQTATQEESKIDRPLFIFGISVVVIVRIGFFIGAYFGIPVEFIAITGALCLLLFYGIRQPTGVVSIIRQAPWYIVVFAFGMYAVVYGFHMSGGTELFKDIVQFGASHGLLASLLVTGILLTVMSCLMNNLPSVMIGTIVLTGVNLSPHVLQLSYLANVLGSDIGSLLLPIGTLASLLWFHIVRQQMSFTWLDYMKVSFVVIPPSLLISILALYEWGNLIIK